jgi:MFS family permease
MLEGALHAVMVGVAESYLGAFAVELGHGPQRLALLCTLPLLAGACCQLLSPKFCIWLGSRKRLALAGALGQAMSVGGMVVIAAAQSSSFGALLAAKLGFWISAGAMAPAWNAWMADLTRHTERPRYFARRSALNHLALFLAFGVAGYMLHGAGVHVLDCFVSLFVIAFVARLASVVALALQADVEPPGQGFCSDRLIVPRLRRAAQQGQFKVTLYLAALAFGTQVAAPFFAPYMLRELSLDYRTFSVLSALSILGKTLTFPICHRVAERSSLARMLRLSGIGVSLIPLVWAVSMRFEALVVAHALGGIVWAALEYASFQLLLEDAPTDLTAEFFALGSAVTGVAQVAGALCGGLLLELPGVGYAQVFLLSALLRALPLTLLFLVLRPQHVPARVRLVYARILSTRWAAMGVSPRPIIGASELPRILGNRTTDPPPAL